MKYLFVFEGFVNPLRYFCVKSRADDGSVSLFENIKHCFILLHYTFSYLPDSSLYTWTYIYLYALKRLTLQKTTPH